ncbi:hypothetical protein [Demequina iriomotensis]|uniref:hypothetical protein n=1 Tax=Demequina iriomotensis TaxID=1536641 RepID=UPI000785BBD5|nr:hypothetical protein [Demequina iriomotensis]
MTDEAEPGAPRPRTAQIIGRTLAFLAPTGLLTGIAYYFGYVSARAYYGYFGVALSALDLPPSQFFIQATDTAFRPLAVGALLGMVALVVHLLIEGAPLRRHPRAVRGTLVVAALAVVALTVVGLIGLLGGRGGPLAAAALAGAAILTEYAIWIAVSTEALGAAASAVLRSRVELRQGLLFAIVAISIFWATTNLAESRGIERATLMEGTLLAQQRAVVYSSEPLFVSGTGVETERLRGAGDDLVYRYDGLRTLVYSRDRWFLLPMRWHRGSDDPVIILPETPGALRVELLPAAF